MSKFIGVKMVEAAPMTAGEAINKGYRIGNSIPDAKGYEVTYPDGYKSWCPADVFEANNFKLSDTNDGTKILKEDVEAFIDDVDIMTVGDKTTVINAHTLTGFDMVRHSSCVDPQNYDEELGAKYAMEEVINNLWGHLGFVLQWAKYGLKRKKEVLPAHIQRVIYEHKALEIRLIKLSKFIDENPNFNGLEVEEQERLKKQRVLMIEYLNVLNERLDYAYKSLGIAR